MHEFNIKICLSAPNTTGSLTITSFKTTGPTTTSGSTTTGQFTITGPTTTTGTSTFNSADQSHF